MHPQRTATATSTTADAKEQQLTAEEAKQLEAAFKDKDFCKLLSDYVSDISNPKFKEEQEAYLAQLEAQNELPTGKMLIRPSSGFVIKCMHKKKKRGGEDDGPPSKLFLNIVHSDEIDEPTTTASNKSKSKNLEGSNNWSVPYAISPLRMEHDKSGNNLVATFDCCFHPISLRYAHGNKKFLELVIDIAKDAVTRSFKASGDEVEMLPDYTILKGVSYKSGSVPKSLMVSTANANVDTDTDANNQCEDRQRSGNDSTCNKPSRSKSSKAVNAVPVLSSSNDASVLAKSDGGKDTEPEPLVPKYKIVEQGTFDIADHTMLQDVATAAAKRPKQLIVHINLDEEETSAANINLDVSEKMLKIIPDSKCRYKLDLELPYPVNSQKGNASFDKRRNVLIVKLPVVVDMCPK